MLSVKDTIDVQGILGFSREQTKVAANGRVEDRIWVDLENCDRQIKSYGF